MSEEEISFKIDWTPEQKKAFKDITGFTELDDDYIKIEQLLTVVEKQQKEIEELKNDNSILCEIAYTGKRIQLPYTMVYTGTDNFIGKDKIREKIKELHLMSISQDIYLNDVEKLFKELLEEQ